jgi:phage terminase large subunit-like protein
MSGPHPDAVGSYGAEAIDWLEAQHGLTLRWWQRLVITRELEHDAEGALVWIEALISTARQVGKSIGMRGLALWRLHAKARFGEEQLILHTGKDLPVCKEVQRPARAWARARAAEGYRVREQNGNEEILVPDGSRWIVRSKDSVYGYPAGLGMCDEAWGVKADVVEDGLEPTMAERRSPQLVLASTAHRKTTPLFPARRAAAIAHLAAPSSSLIIEWSAPRGADLEDRDGWRQASPHWSPTREKLLAAKLDRARAGESDDPDEDDPIESFRSQYLNMWPPRAGAGSSKDEALVELDVWQSLGDLTISAPGAGLVCAVEDWVGMGSAGAAAVLLGDGRVLVWGGLFKGRADALAWAGYLLESHPGSRLIVGASLVADEAATALGVELGAAGAAETLAALPLVRQLVRDGRLVHGADPVLTTQLGGIRVVERSGGLGISPRSGRSDLVRAMAWAVQSLVNVPAPQPFYVY